MENTDSDTENECFESAEESVDEEEKNDINTKLKSGVLESDSESSERIGSVSNSTVSPAHEFSKDVSGNLMSYRKRPERVKRLQSKPSEENISKSPDESILKTGKILSDIFLQDIPSNLSKNINKSLSTLQQTSSNVKELIFKSLPVSSINSNEGFSYDDKNLFSTVAVSHEDPKNTESIRNRGDNLKNKQESSGEKVSPKEVSHSGGDGQCDDIENEKQLNIKTNNLDGDVNIVQEVEANVLDDAKKIKCNSEMELSKKNPDNPSLNSNYRNETAEDCSKLKVEIATELENLGSSKMECRNRSNLEISEPNDQNPTCQENSLTAITMSQRSNVLQNIKSNINSEICSKPSSDKENQDQNLIKEKCLSHFELKNSDNCNTLMSSLETTENNERLDTETDDSNKSGEPNSNSESNFNKLKTALKNIIEEDKLKLDDGGENLEETFEKAELIYEGKIVEDQSSKEGWDDFDFSDQEDESAFKEDIIKNNENVNLVEEKVFLNNQQTNNSTIISDANFANKKINKEIFGANYASKKENAKTDSINTNLQTVVHKSNDKNIVTKRNKTTKGDKENINKEIVEIKPVTEDVWAWDTWEETTEESKEGNEEKSKNFESKNLEDDVSDLSKWSGWDNFGQKSEEKTGNWGLGSWGVDMLLNKATAVTQGLSNVLEAKLGAPDPETLARMDKMERESMREQNKNKIATEDEPSEISNNSLASVNLFPVSGLTSLVAEVTSKIVEHSKIQEIGSKVITGSLDTLETFGKKTMEVLQEGDPGLKNKRALLLGDEKPVISQILREAREKADREIKRAEEREFAKKCHFETLFDDFQGLVHLEALEMLSTQYELKLEQLRSGMNSKEQEDLNSVLEEVEQLCSLDDNDMDLKTSSKIDFKKELQAAVEPLKSEISIQRIIQIHEKVSSWWQESCDKKPSIKNVNQKLVSIVAELAAATIQQFHKSGELLSVKECRKTVEEIDALSRLTNLMCIEINKLCEKFVSYSKEEDIKGFDSEWASFSENVTTVMTNSTSYIKQAFNLLIPVLQFGAAVY